MYKITAEDVIPLEEAINEAANWRALAHEKLGEEDYVKAFTIPMIDFTQILAEGAVSIRAYLGNTDGNEKKLLLVGVDDQNRDMIDYDNGHYVYDFTTPCPAMCYEPSPLNGSDT